MKIIEASYTLALDRYDTIESALKAIKVVTPLDTTFIVTITHDDNNRVNVHLSRREWSL